MPVVKLDYIRYMMEIAESEEPDGVMSRSSTFIEPLYAFYSVGMAGTFESEIKKNNLRLFDVISRSNIHFVDYSKVKEYCRDADIFTNLNYRTDLDALEKIYMEDRVPVVSIVSAISGAGKTTLITGIIKNLKSRNYKVGILKHDVKKFEIDYPGKDSYKFTEAGADNVIIASPSKLAMIQNLQNKKSIEEMLWLFRDEDIVIVEGFKNNRYPKIEIHRKEAGSALLCKSPEHSHTDFIAVASDEDLDMDIPVLNIDDSVEISDFIEKLFLKGRGDRIVMENLKIPNMILIGATARNSGKTALAAAIINKYKSKRPVVAVKVTTVAEKGGKCIRGGEGCGACSGLKGDFEITEEHDKISKGYINAAGCRSGKGLLAEGSEKPSAGRNPGSYFTCTGGIPL